MNWITQEKVKEQAQKGEMEALQCSLLHHQQGRDATRGGLVDAIEDDIFHLSNTLCACCRKYNTSCSKCPLTTISKGIARERCCDGVYSIADVAGKAFFANPSNENHKAFTEAESKVCDYIQGVIDKKLAEEKKPELDYEKAVVAAKKGVDGQTSSVLLVSNCNAKSYDVKGYDWIKLTDGKFNSCYCFKTKKEAVDCYREMGYNIRNIDFGNIFDDLKAISKPLTEFEMESLSTDKSIGFEISTDGNLYIYIDRPESSRTGIIIPFHEIALNLRRMEATLRSKK